MKILFLLLCLTGCSSKINDMSQDCELECTECKYVELKCKLKTEQDNKDLGRAL